MSESSGTNDNASTFDGTSARTRDIVEEDREAASGSASQVRFRFLLAYSVALRVLISYGIFTFLTAVRGPRWADRRRGAIHRRNARRVTRAILRLKGLYIKVGQLVSILTNFLPEDFRAGLEGLQDRIPPRPLSEIAARIRGELGAEPATLFAWFNPVAVASASLAQVHEARLADGRHVAVKVQHADIEEIARRDLRTIRSILRLVGTVTRVAGLDEQYRQLEEMILDELNFEQERRNLETIAENLADDPGIVLPRVVPERSSHRVLTTEFVEGVKVTDLDGLASIGIERKDLANRIVAAYARMIFEDGIYHADPHPGNIIIRNDGAIAFVDFGAVARLSPEMKAGIPRFLLALIRRDVEGLREALRVMGFIARGGEKAVADALDRFHERLFDQINLEELTLGEVNPDATMEMKMEALSDLRSLDVSLRELTSAFRVPKDWLLLERTMLLLAGLCTHLDPSMNPLGAIRPYVERHLLGGEGGWSATLRTAIGEMIYSAFTLPAELRRTMVALNRGELELRIRDVRESAWLLYGLGRQIIYVLFTLGSATVAYGGYVREDRALLSLGIYAGAFFFLCFLVSSFRARRWRR